jgi:hypothetical protein
MKEMVGIVCLPQATQREWKSQKGFKGLTAKKTPSSVKMRVFSFRGD